MSSSKDKRPCVLVVGDWMNDVWVTIKPRQMSAEADIIVYDETASRTYDGGAGNVVRNLENLGGLDVVYPIPHDPQDRPTKIRFVDETGRQHFRVDQHDYNDGVDVEDLEDISKSWSPSVVVISDYKKGVVDFTTTKTLNKLFPEATYLIDTKGSPWNFGFKNRIYFPNMAEYSEYHNEYSMYKDNIIVKRGAKGTFGPHVGDGYEVFECTPTSPVANPRSVCGAGDVFLACFAQQFALGNDMVSCIRSANEKTAEVIRFGYETLVYGNMWSQAYGK